MALPAADTASAPPPAPAGGLGAGRWRLRLALWAAFAVIGLAVLLQGWNTLRLEQVRAADAEILDRAGMQRTFSQQLARLAAQLQAEPALRSRRADALATVFATSSLDALALEDLLAAQARHGGDGAAVAQALEHWQAARERLWYRTGVLLLRADEGSDEEVARAASALLDEADPALAAAAALSRTLREAAEHRTERLRNEVAIGVGLLLLLLLVLGLAAVEPAARSVRRHAERLAEQATELQRLALVAEHTTAMVLISDREDRIRWTNAAFTRLSGWSAEEAVGRLPSELLHSPHADPAVTARVAEAVAQGRGIRLEWLNRTRDGREIWLDVDLRPLHDADGRLSGFVSVSSDVTARVQQQRKLQALWSALPAGVIVQGEDGRVVEANRAAERLLGYGLAEMQAMDPGDARWRALREDGSDYSGAEHPAMATLRHGAPLRNVTMGVRTPQGARRWLLLNTEPLRDSTGSVSGVVSCFTDITESRELHERLAASARTDALTRLPNRAVVMERLQRVIAHAARHPGYGFAVLFMDFDRFKQVNDTLGHGAGDELLRQIAGRLLESLRPGDAVARVDSDLRVAARIGGDEFVVVLEGVHDAATVQVVTERLLADLAEPYLLGSTPVQSSASVGVVLVRDGRTTAEEVLRNADTAMYEAKRAGRGRWVLFDDSMHQRVVRALALETDLRRALREDELFVVYQPVVDLATRRVTAVEALVRWRHPERGLVPPGEFIAVAEECGLIDAVGSVVLREACGQFAAWRRTLGALAPPLLAVNLSRAQLKRGDLVDDLRALLQEAGLAPGQLQLEVTESLAAQDEDVQATLRALKSLGVKLALDDFGTGYSSLACLHQMPVDTVKVDRSFVRHAETVEYHRVLIEATIRVARTLGMTTVAEGIETEGQAALMMALSCDRGQGFLFARPLEAAAFEAWAQDVALAMAGE
ncbi:MAG: EAL domain-containing protein [Rubrivivax sp.]|nr:EAL domain-containing protein [Rubrivivax sp.]